MRDGYYIARFTLVHQQEQTRKLKKKNIIISSISKQSTRRPVFVAREKDRQLLHDLEY